MDEETLEQMYREGDDLSEVDINPTDEDLELADLFADAKKGMNVV